MSDEQRMTSRRFLMAKALAFTNSITKLSSDERKDHPSLKFGEDYNRLRESVESEFPELKKYLPPRVDFWNGDYGSGATQKYGEILSWCEQLYQLLDSIQQPQAKDI